MAGLEVAASVVGIVSLGIEIGKNAMKLRDFYKSVKGAPEEIGYLLEEIETFRMIFSNFEALGNDVAGASPIEPSLPMQTCLARCQREAEIVASQVRSLNAEIGTRRKVGSFKAVLKRGSIEKLRERLKTAAFLLMFSHGLYSSESQKQSHLFQQNWFAMYSHQLVKVQHIEAAVTQNRLVSSDPPESGNECSHIMKVNQASQKNKTDNLHGCEEKATIRRYRQRRLAQLKLPRWLRTVGIGIEIYYNPGRYVLNNCNIHVYNTVDWDAPILQLTETGDLDGIRRLLDKGKATPFDRNPSGFTVLDVPYSLGSHSLPHQT